MITPVFGSVLPFVLAGISLGFAGSLTAAGAQTPPPRPAVRMSMQSDAFYTNSWPVDLNKDGKTDIVSASGFPDERFVYALGRGDGTFGPVVRTEWSAVPLGVGDVNNDGNVDVVLSGMAILRGRGDGTFGPVYPVTGAPAMPVTGNEDPLYLGRVAPGSAVADIDGDGLRDIVVFGADETSVHIYRGIGDFGFAGPAVLPLTSGPGRFVMAADLNADGRRDIIAAGHGPVTIMLNTGRLTFDVRELNATGSGATVGDLNRDGKADLLVAVRGGYGMSREETGGVMVLLGNGDGTFAAGRTFATGKQGTVSVVVGDFNKDGLLDAATGNRSWRYTDNFCATSFSYSDSVTILPGTGDGRLGVPAAFRLDDSPGELGPYVDGHNALRTSDFNGDGRTDLFASPGALLLNVPVAANRPPIVSAGPDQELDGPAEASLRASSQDPDAEWIEYRWSGPDGLDVDTPHTCSPTLVRSATLFVTATDDRGASATDSMHVRVLGPAAAHAGADVGSVAAAGSTTFDGDSYTVSGSGADVWGTADEFHWFHQEYSGDFEIHAKVVSVEQVDAWTKAGLMVREGLDAGARHASVFVTPGVKGVAFQRRPTTSGISVSTAGPLVHAPVWIRLKRTGNIVSAYYSADPMVWGQWQLIGRQEFSELAESLEVGLAVSSHKDGVLATARFESVVLGELGTRISRDIGEVGLAGTQVTAAPDAVTLTGSGADIWGTADAFRFHFQEQTLDGTITARVSHIENTHAWAKAGVMVRENLTAGSKHVMVVVTPGKGVAMQYRAVQGGMSLSAGTASGTAPAWVRLTRQRDAFTGYVSEDGVSWTAIGTIDLRMAGDAWAGVAVTSHNNEALATAAFDHVALRR